LIKSLEVSKITNFKKSDIKVNSFGDISHLQTLIFSKAENICPFELLKNLHPSPAVCGYPKNVALDWINTLESFLEEIMLLQWVGLIHQEMLHFF